MSQSTVSDTVGKMENIDRGNPPKLPWPLARPLSLVPNHLHSALLARILNTVFSAHIHAGDLEFLRKRSLTIRVLDADIEFRLTLIADAIVAEIHDGISDLCISGSVYDYLTLLSRREDADTLFFQRRLKMEGDTELGLYVKNFLDGLDVDSLILYRQADFIFQRGVSLFERLFS